MLNQVIIKKLNIKLDVVTYLSNNTKEYFLENANRDSANEKINSLLQKKNDFIDEMIHY